MMALRMNLLSAIEAEDPPPATPTLGGSVWNPTFDLSEAAASVAMEQLWSSLITHYTPLSMSCSEPYANLPGRSWSLICVCRSASFLIGHSLKD